MDVSQRHFGHLPGGQAVELYSLANNHGLEVELCSYGGIIRAINAPDRTGQLADIVLGFDTLAEYLAHNPFFGCLVGRYANRIAGGRFVLDGELYQLAQNDGSNHLHGGQRGFDKVLWQAEVLDHGIKLSYLSPDNEEHYPGTLAVSVSYILDDDNALTIHYQATTDRPTIINLTNHSYFNLSGETDILAHELKLNADAFTPIDQGFIPSGELRSVQGSPFDFKAYRPIGERMFAEDEQLAIAGGYDHNWIINGEAGALRLAASVRALASGRQLDVFTTQPGIQIYSSNMLPELMGKEGQRYQRHAALCLETQHYPDSPNQPHFPSVVLRPGEVYEQRTVFRFSSFA